MARSWLLALVAALVAAPSLRGAARESDAWLRPAAGVPNGRQIVGRDGGRYWAMVPDWQDATLQLQALRRQTAGGQFAVEGRVRLAKFDPAQTQAAMIVDQRGRWHWATSDADGVRYQALPAGQVADCLSRGAALPPAEEQWTVGQASLGDMLLLPGGAPCVGMVRSEGADRVVTLRWKSGGVWRQSDIARGKGLRPPVIDAAGDELCLSWCDGGGRIWFQKIRWQQLGKAAAEAPQEIGRPGRRPSILCAGELVFVAYEEWWNEISTKVLDGRRWRTFRVTEFEPRLTVDVSHSPHLALDVHGVPWLFFSDANRRFVYYARWLGDGWSDIADGRGIFQRAPYYDGSLLSADWLSVEKHPPAGQLGMVLANASSGAASFQTLPVVMPKAAPGRRVLFLDMLEVARTEGLKRQLVPATKDKANPVFTPSPDPKAFDSLRVFSHGTVLYEGGRFRMWYPGMGQFGPSVPWWRQLKIGYAESEDGRRFHRVELPAGNGLGAGSGHVDPPLPFVVALCRDDEDPDPARRYKLIDFLNAGLQTEAAAAGDYDLDAQFFPGFLYTSPDGLRWTREPAEMRFPGGRPLSFVPLCLLLDPEDPDPQRRWKAYGFMSLTYRRRAGGLAYSPDARHWTGHPRNPVLDPQTNRMPIVPAGRLSQIHDTIVWRDAGLYLCLFQDQRNMDSLPLELAVSRDGEHFVYVQPGQPFIPEGGPGDWDSYYLLPSPPVDRGDELWFYYAGSARGHDKPDDLRTSAGLARARKEGFTCLELAAGKAAGSLTTVPFEPAGRLRMFVNAACNHGTIRVELLGADGRPLPGHAAAQCRPIAGDRVRIPVVWSDGEELRTASPFRIRFVLEGADVRFYSFGFDPPP